MGEHVCVFVQVNVCSNVRVSECVSECKQKLKREREREREKYSPIFLLFFDGQTCQQQHLTKQPLNELFETDSKMGQTTFFLVEAKQKSTELQLFEKNESCQTLKEVL